MQALQDALNELKLVENIDWAAVSARALVIFITIIAIIFATRFIARAAQRTGEKLSNNIAIGNLADTLVKVIAWVVGVFLVLRILNLEGIAYSVLAGAGVAGIVIGFALQDIAANFVAGIILAIQRPFRVGHLIHTSEEYGIVKQIHLRSTELETLDGQLVHIPNKSILLNSVTNYNYIPYRRVEITVGVGYSADLQHASKIAIQAVKAIECCEKNRPIDLYYDQFSNSSIDFTIRFWTRFKNEIDFLAARSAAIIAIQQAYKKHGIEIPYPITTILKPKN